MARRVDDPGSAAPMNFYQHQDRARRKTVMLLGYFLAAVAAITASVDTVVYFIMQAGSPSGLPLMTWMLSHNGLAVSAAVAASIGAGTAYTSLRLSGGGQAVARLVGARRIAPATPDARERQLLNVVEEMSIAAGTPVPALYVLDGEDGINAFVAGMRPTETVLVVTAGALAAFSRDELQGVVGHEYSHILNQDMRLNLRLMGMLAGILLISRMGRLLMRSGGRSDGKASGQLALLGFALFALGYLGVILGSLIQAAVSRQREFLADASAVQFTRNPRGIAGALQRILAHTAGSRLRNAHADDLAHCCFGAPVPHAFSRWLSTHPPLPARIRAIDPSFDVTRWRLTADQETESALAVDVTVGFAAGGAVAVARSPAHLAAAAGTVTAAQMSAARQLHADLPAPLLVAARAAPAQMIYALLLQVTAPAARAAARALLERREGPAAAQASAGLSAILEQGCARARLPLLNLSLPALKALDQRARQRLLALVADIIQSDRQFTVFEFVIQQILVDHLGDAAGRAVPVRYYTFAAVAMPLRVLLSVLARAGASDGQAAASAYARAFAPFALGPATLLPESEGRLSALGPALGELAALSPLLKQNVIHACGDGVSSDGLVTAAEAELLQAVALTLDCPLPFNGDALQ